ncbi:hypothetical protein BOTU111921_27050 [Bordetella tumbae]
MPYTAALELLAVFPLRHVQSTTMFPLFCSDTSPESPPELAPPSYWVAPSPPLLAACKPENRVDPCTVADTCPTFLSREPLE